MKKLMLFENAENFWSSWLRDDERGKEGRMAKAEKNE